MAEPFRLDLTVSGLRRVPTNLVDVLTPAGDYLHALLGPYGPMVLRVTQVRPGALGVTLEGAAQRSADDARIPPLVRRTLGTDRDLTPFYEGAERLPWLAPLARRMRGFKPSRYRSLWESVVNSVVFQQVSLHAASAIVRRLVTALGTPVEGAEMPLYLFPEIGRVLDATDAALRATGLSIAKIATLRYAGEAIDSGALTETMIEERPNAEAVELLRRVKGIGPWTASVILLRGFGRLDVFPQNDSGAARSLRLVAGDGPLDIHEVLTTLGPYQGMLYFHLFLARLEARGELP